MTTQTTSNVEHSGVKGMKWGVRKDRGHEGESVKTKKLPKLDKQYDQSFMGIGGWVKVNNTVADKINPKLDVLNAKPEYQTDIRKDPKLQKKYFNEYEKVLKQSLEEATAEFGTNASGTKQFKLTLTGKGEDAYYDGDFVDIEHAGMDDMPAFRVNLKFNGKGHIIDQTIVDREDDTAAHGEDFAEGYFLKHYGIKGMRWGVRRDKTPTAVTVNARPGKLVKAKGGKYQAPSEDAIAAARARQQAKRSSVDSLSNQELRLLVDRMGLEQRYNQLKNDPERMNLGVKMTKTALENGGASLAVSGLTKAAVATGKAANPQVAIGLKVASMVAEGVGNKQGGKKKKK